MTARGLRNNNPGNLRHSAEFTWDGELDPDADGYCVFVDAHHGLRALCKDLLAKWRRGLRSVRKITAVYAPPSENDTAAYVTNICAALHVGPDDPVDLNGIGTLTLYAKTVTRQENGSVPYQISEITAAARDALGMPDHVEGA